jgi:hypothetical protein
VNYSIYKILSFKTALSAHLNAPAHLYFYLTKATAYHQFIQLLKVNLLE